MKYYRIAAPFLTVVGQLHLTDAQAAGRDGMLTVLDPADHGENRFATRQAVGFKHGEEFGCSADLARGGAEVLDLKPAAFERRVREERAAAAADKARILKARAEAAVKVQRIREQREKEALAKREATDRARKAKLEAASRERAAAAEAAVKPSALGKTEIDAAAAADKGTAGAADLLGTGGKA